MNGPLIFGDGLSAPAEVAAPRAGHHTSRVLPLVVHQNFFLMRLFDEGILVRTNTKLALLRLVATTSALASTAASFDSTCDRKLKPPSYDPRSCLNITSYAECESHDYCVWESSNCTIDYRPCREALPRRPAPWLITSPFQELRRLPVRRQQPMVLADGRRPHGRRRLILVLLVRLATTPGTRR